MSTIITKQHQEQQSEQETIPQELIQKFNNDEQLVQEFLEQDYTMAELQGSTITHPTRYDPLCTLEDGTVAGMWIESTEKNHKYNYRTYKTRLHAEDEYPTF